MTKCAPQCNSTRESYYANLWQTRKWKLPKDLVEKNPTYLNEFFTQKDKKESCCQMREESHMNDRYFRRGILIQNTVKHTFLTMFGTSLEKLGGLEGRRPLRPPDRWTMLDLTLNCSPCWSHPRRPSPRTSTTSSATSSLLCFGLETLTNSRLEQMIVASRLFAKTSPFLSSADLRICAIRASTKCHATSQKEVVDDVID